MCECVSDKSIINSTEQDQRVVLPRVHLQYLDEGEGSLTFALSAVANSDCRLTSLRNQLRLHHMNGEERASIVKICEEYKDIFHLPKNKLNCTSTIEHAILTPTVDPRREINVKPNKIPKINRDEVQRETEQILADGVIQHISNVWNSLILVPKKLYFSGKRNWRIVVDFRELNYVTV